MFPVLKAAAQQGWGGHSDMAVKNLMIFIYINYYPPSHLIVVNKSWGDGSVVKVLSMEED